MRLASGIYAIFFLLALVLGGLLAAYVAQRQYQTEYDKLVDGALATVLSRPDLQLQIYRSDEAKLADVLTRIIEPEAVPFAAVYDSLSKLLARRATDGAVKDYFSTIGTVRASASVADTTLIAFDELGAETGTSFWSSLMGEVSLIHLTTPVLSTVNPTKQGLTASDFIQSLSAPELTGSRVVMGYVHVVIDRSQLMHSVVREINRVLLVYILLLGLCAAALFFVIRRVTAPLAKLTQVARQIDQGERKERVDIKGDGELQDLVRVLNSVIDGGNNYQQEVEVDRKLMGMKISEGASKLTQRDGELDKAAQEISAANDKLHRLAHYDSLTNLPNRTLFAEQLRLLLSMSERDGKPLALLFLNLKNFKRINDSLGRRAGDLLLMKVGKRLTSCLRASDMLGHYSGEGPRIDVSRLGGDEFSIVLNQIDRAEAASLVAQRVIESLTKPLTIEGQELVVTPCIGIVVAPQDGSEVEQLVRAATTAMHHAAEIPNGGFLFYKDTMDAGNLDHIKMAAELRKAIERNQLQLHYQPQVDTVDGAIVGAEALLRWEHPEFGQVPPFRFIPIAEEAGLIEEFGNWVLVEACRQVCEYQSQGLKLPRVAINVSGMQFGASFASRIEEVLRESDLPASMLELGLSADILMDDRLDTIKALEDLSVMGVYLSVDNFGASHVSLSYLTHYPLNELKIDRSFVTECDKRPANANMVKAIIALATSLNLHTVAEGVETEGEFRFLVESGARIMQGYLFSKPVPAQQLQQQLLVPWHYMAQIHRMALTQQ
jgi:diguanylate cyclase (GGDEF)-like protein